MESGALSKIILAAVKSVKLKKKWLKGMCKRFYSHRFIVVYIAQFAFVFVHVFVFSVQH